MSASVAPISDLPDVSDSSALNASSLVPSTSVRSGEAQGQARPGEQSFLAFDYGLKRVGVASGNTVLRQAQPLRTLHSMGQARFDEVAQLVREWQPHALVVGVPYHPDGAAHANTARARRFARQLVGRLGLPVHEVDERYSTVEAQAEGARDVDAAAAAVILQQFLDQST